MKRIGRYNVNAYNDTAMFSCNYRYYLVVIDKFTPTNTYIGKKSFYFSHPIAEDEFTRESLDALWELPEYSRITGKKVIWEVRNKQ